MNSNRPRWLLILLAAVAILLPSWTIYEAQSQRRTIRESLTRQASVLAGALGPGLVAASHAARELEEIVLWKLLDNARLFAELDPIPDAERLESLAVDNGLDTVALVDGAGAILQFAGEQPPPGVIEQLGALLDDQADEIIIGSTIHKGIQHLSAAATGPHGRLALVRIHSSTAHVFSAQLGVPNLLEHLVGSEGVLYLSYTEGPDPLTVQASWDGSSLPPAAQGTELRDFGNHRAFEVEMPLPSPAGNHASLRVGLDGSSLEDAATAAWRRSLLVGLVLLGIALVASGTAIMGRVHAQERRAARRRLATFEEERRRSSRLAAAGAVTAGLAHEVRSPLNAIGMAAQRLQRKLESGSESHSIARRLNLEVRRLEGVLRSFLELAKPEDGQRRICDLHQIASEAVSLLEAEAEAGQIDLLLEPFHAFARVHPDSIHRAIVNLIRNALQASTPGHSIWIEAATSDQRSELRIRDEGRGLDPAIKDRLFDAFVSSRVEGTGLGLPLVQRVAEEHDGSITIEENPGGGVQATLSLPRAEARDV